VIIAHIRGMFNNHVGVVKALRFSNLDVLLNIEGVLVEIAKEL
jgi:very-short-patch-repair endonuclease